MGESSKYSLTEFASFLEQESPAVPSSHYSPEEIKAIRSLAQRYKEPTALAQVRQLAEEYKEFSFVRLIESVAKESFKEKQFIPPNKNIELSSSSKIRLHIYKMNPKAKVIIIKNDIAIFEAITLPRVPNLEQDYGFKGGAARLALSAILGGSIKNRVPRDFDIVRFDQVSTELDDIIAEKYMPEDLKYGHGIELVPNLTTYFKTRDLSVNEVVYINDKVICSVQALQDTINEILRPTQHILNDKDQIPGKVVMKMIRLLAEATIEGRSMTLCLPDSPKVTPFDIALHLDRALHRGSRLAEIYIVQCIKYGFLCLDEDHSSIGDTIEYLKDKTNRSLNGFDNLQTKKEPKKNSLLKKAL